MIKEITLKELINSQNVSQIRCSWDSLTNTQIEHLTMYNCHLERLAIKGAVVKNTRIKHSLVEDCFFYGVKFINVDFTGSKLLKCNFKNAQFYNCKFDYVHFHECILDERKVIYNLGDKNIINKMIILELRKNALSVGKNSTNDKLIMLEKEYLRKYLRRKLFDKNQRGNYKVKFKEKMRILFNLSRLYLGFFIWGYGIQISRLIITAALVLISFAGIYRFFFDFTVIESISTSLIMFSTVGYLNQDVLEHSNQLVFGIEGFFGAVFIALLASSLYRKITR